MAVFKVFRETALPGSLDPYSVYFVAPAAKPDYIELYVSDSTGTGVRRIIDSEDVQNLIDNSISTLSGIEIVDDIAERDALTPTANVQVLVLDASTDPTVTSGAATYIYKLSTTTWYKVSEAESLDVILSWANIQNKPTSTVSQIDTAVANSHTHANKTQLDKISQDVNGNLTYNNSLPVIAWSSVGW
jgi:hypothetical protein